MQLKIWHKMIIGISIPSFLAILGGIITYAYISDVKNRQGFVQIADDLKEHVLEIRRNEKNFFHFKNAEYFKNVNNAISVLTNSIDSISTETAKEIGKEKILQLGKSAQIYSSLVDNLYKNYHMETEVTEEVRTEGRKLETFVETGKHAKDLTISFVFNLRRLEKNYMLFRDKQSFFELNNNLTQLKNIIPFCYECTPYIEAIRNLFTIHEESDSILNNLQKTGDKFEEITGEIAGGERKRISSFFTLTQWLLLVTLALLCTLGPLFVYKTATYIAAPIKRLSEITNKISEGDLTLRAPLKGHDETFSLAISFNTMLDHLQLTQESLEKSLELLHEKQAQLVESEKRASMGFLVSGVAHELNNPLNNISLTAETMMEDIEELSREELKGYVHDVFIQSERAHNIVENLLDFARARRSTEMEKLDLIQIVKGSIKLIANQLRVNNIKLHQDIPDGILYIKGNLSKLEQILVNIILNAIQAMKDSGTLTISIKPDTENKNIFIKISDTGPGIPEENLKNIFEPFFTTKPVGKGTGLGLSVTRTLVAEHNGEIKIESKLGVGTTFIIILPLYEETV
jgi:signal transduction histidine kinase